MSQTIVAVTPSGSRVLVDEVQVVDGQTYVRSRKIVARFTIEPGDQVGGLEVLAYLGHRVIKDGREPAITDQRYYLVRCPHGRTGPKRHSSLTSIKNNTPNGYSGGEPRFRVGCFRECSEKPYACRWCGTKNPKRFRSIKTTCMSCDRVGQRLGKFPCGKPRRRYLSSNLRVPDEHQCEECEPWRRAEPRERHDKVPARRIQTTQVAGTFRTETLSCGHVLIKRRSERLARRRRCWGCLDGRRPGDTAARSR